MQFKSIDNYVFYMPDSWAIVTFKEIEPRNDFHFPIGFWEQIEEQINERNSMQNLPRDVRVLGWRSPIL